jgi:hypothetical protein
LEDGSLPSEINEIMYTPITVQELKNAVHQGARNKSPGFEEITHDFYVLLWDAIKDELMKIYNTLLSRKCLTPSQP